MYNVIASGSTGNSVIYHNSIMVDCGVPFSKLSQYVQNLQLILLTHWHKDHFNIKTIDRIMSERPALRIGCCEWMADKINYPNRVDIYEIGQVYSYNIFEICPVKLYHDVPNCGYRIFKNGTSIFHATDTAHLDGISAKNYDLYAIEHNYDEDIIAEVIASKKENDKFSYEIGAMNSHLSEQQAGQFIFNNRKPESQVLKLHESKQK